MEEIPLFEGIVDYRLAVLQARSVLLGVVGESCWEIELCLRLTHKSTILIFVIDFCEKVFTLGFLLFLPGEPSRQYLSIQYPKISNSNKETYEIETKSYKI